MFQKIAEKKLHILKNWSLKICSLIKIESVAAKNYASDLSVCFCRIFSVVMTRSILVSLFVIDFRKVLKHFLNLNTDQSVQQN